MVFKTETNCPISSSSSSSLLSSSCLWRPQSESINRYPCFHGHNPFDLVGSRNSNQDTAKIGRPCEVTTGNRPTSLTRFAQSRIALLIGPSRYTETSFSSTNQSIANGVARPFGSIDAPCPAEAPCLPTRYCVEIISCQTPSTANWNRWCSEPPGQGSAIATTAGSRTRLLRRAPYNLDRVTSQ